MTEQAEGQAYPISFEIVETFSIKGNRLNTLIGNTGGKFTWSIDAGHFNQHFAPDGSWDPAVSRDLQQKHSVLYPAVLWEFIKWQDGLPDDDPRKNLTTIKGSTNETMSNFRAKLLGSSYSHRRIEDKQQPENPVYTYETNLTQLREDSKTMARLKKLSSRAKRNNYTTSVPLQKPGEVKRISVNS